MEDGKIESKQQPNGSPLSPVLGRKPVSHLPDQRSSLAGHRQFQHFPLTIHLRLHRRPFGLLKGTLGFCHVLKLWRAFMLAGRNIWGTSVLNSLTGCSCTHRCPEKIFSVSGENDCHRGRFIPAADQQSAYKGMSVQLRCRCNFSGAAATSQWQTFSNSITVSFSTD